MELSRTVYQITGLDDRERGFTRQVEVSGQEGQFIAILRYETTKLEIKGHATELAAIEEMVRRLHARGYTQLQTRMQFKGEEYLGNQEWWTEHPDPWSDQPEAPNWWAGILRKFGWTTSPPAQTKPEDHSGFEGRE